MATVFQNSTLPLWVWVVIIVVGAGVILGTIAFVARLMIIRRRRAEFVDTFGDENLPQRKVTVRRGRVVEQSKYLSLTGSKFGLNAFGPDETDTSSRAGARSKSPFEWWSTVKDRSQSRNSQLTTTNDTASIYGLPSSPSHQRVFQRRDLNQSNTSLASTSKDGDVSITVTVTETIPRSPPAIVRNFSRSFSRPGPYSKYSPRQQNTLSRIEEFSPHTSMISTRQSRIASYTSNNRRDTKSSTTSSSAGQSPRLSSQFPQPPRWSSMTTSSSSSPTSSSIYHEAKQNQSATNLPMSQVPPPPLPPPSMAYNGSRSSFGDPEPGPSHIPDQAGHRDSSSHNTQHRLSSTSITALPEQSVSQSPMLPATNNYWETRTDLYPVGTNGKRGRVLRKKSLKKAEVVTRIDS